MAETISIAEARQRSGLRLAMLGGFPSPWSQAARGILDIKGIPFARVQPTPEDGAEALQDWSGQSSYPAAVYEQEAPRSGWAEILLLAERLAPEPALVPDDAAERARFFGVAHEICGEMGLGWCRRLLGVHPGMALDPPDPMAKWLGEKYGYRPDSLAVSQRRVTGILGLLDDMLATSRAAGGLYLMGPQLTALDVYWATFCNLILPLPAELLPMPEGMRKLFTASDPETIAALSKPLIEHRDFVYQEHLTLPVEL